MAMPSSLAWYQGAGGEKAGITPSSEFIPFINGWWFQTCFIFHNIG
jgi:hypothetical protein